MNRLTRRATLGAATALALTQGAGAQAWPNKPIRILVPFPAGGIVDIVTRALADPMQADLGQTIVVEPKPGGNAAMATVATAVATVNPSLPVKTLKELVEYAKANPGKLNYLNPGNGSSLHLSTELLKNQYKLDITAVPYRGVPLGVPDLLEGRLQVGWLPTPLAIQHVQTGKLRALAVLGDKRLATLPDVATFAEAGFAEAQVISWYVIA